MREILFRGKTQHPCGEWIYGSLLTNYPCCKNEVDEIVKEYHIIDGKAKELKMVQVIPKTVGQYTGLTDKNGKKIFDGDLLNGFQYPFLKDNAHNYFAEVVWFENSPAFGLYTHKHPLSAVRGISEGNCDYMEDFDSSQWEIIGNIHDNPELLKEGAADE